MVLNLYFLVNFVVATHILYRAFHGKPYIKKLVVPLVLLSVPMAVGIHTVTAFLYNGLAARPYWNSARSWRRSFWRRPSAPARRFCWWCCRCCGDSRASKSRTQAIWKIAELMAYAMFLNLFLHGAEAFKEFYSNTQHLLFTRYWYFGLGAHHTLVPYAWSAVALNLLAFALFISPDHAPQSGCTLNIGCLATYAGVYIEKGMGLIIPGLTPDTLGRDLRILSHHHRVARGRGHLRRRIPVVHADAEGGCADLAGRVHGQERARACAGRRICRCTARSIEPEVKHADCSSPLLPLGPDTSRSGEGTCGSSGQDTDLRRHDCRRSVFRVRVFPDQPLTMRPAPSPMFV